MRMRLLLVGQDDSLPGGMPVYIRSLRDYLCAATDIEFRYLNETEAKGRSDMHRPSGPLLLKQALMIRKKLLQDIEQFRPDVAHLHVAHGMSIFEKAYLANVCLSRGVPCVLHMHGAGLVENVAKMPPFLRSYLSRAFGYPHRVVALSASIAKELKSAFGAWKITVIANAVDIPPDISPLPGTFTVGFLGYMDGRKGEQDLVEALAHSSPTIQAVLAGDGPNMEAVKARVLELGMAQRVTFAGRVSGDSKDSFLRSISALTLPSYAENYPIALLEAMAYGRTVIASAVGGVPDLVVAGENGWLFPAGDQGMLARALDDAAGSASEVAKRSEAALETIRTRHVWTVTGPILTALYQEAAKV